MSGRKRNRNIQSLPFESLRLEANLNNYLGENIKHPTEYAINSFSDSTSDLEDLSIKISGLSSSSSLSWNEEYEQEVTKKVQVELKKLDKLFQGLGEEDAFPYDLDEIHEWKQLFPHLSILGPETPTNSESSSSEEDTPRKQEKSSAQHRKPNRDHLSYKTPQKEPLPGYHSLPRKSRNLDLDRYLKISSIKSSDTRQRKPKIQLEKLKETHHYDVSSLDFTSLPFITATPLKTNHRQRFERHKNGKMLILPPIDTTFRSISATPRQASSKSALLSNYKRNMSNQEGLKSDLMKLFDSIPISNR